ncbi:hypothetical protein T484DRAFT_3190141 [Baffinella frigidus]|nr:hypothetical protein T484DRAFT_3190141 [Cryptophyta sp. CCMP2293]
MATLEVVRAPERMAKSIALLKATTIFGRDPTSDVLQWDGVSRQHLRLEADARFYNGSGLPTKFILIDSGGANGTFLNGERVTKVSVRDGDRIAIGRGRHLPQGGQMADSNIEYLFVLRTLTKPALAPAHKPAQDRAGSAGVRRQPLGGQEVADGQRRHRDARAGDVPGEVFPPCTSMVYPPSRYAPSAADNRMPDAELVLEFVYGCRGWDTARAVKWFDHSRIIFLAGAFVVIYDKDEHTQRFFTEHDDDVVALAIHPRLPLAASGSIASRERRTPEGRPSCTIMIWNVETRERTLSPEWPSRGVLSRIHQQRIEAMEFDRTGQFLVTYGDKEDGTTMICVYDWKSGKPWFHLSAGASVVNP